VVCRKSFSFKNKKLRLLKEEKIFGKWLKKRTANQLSEDCHCSKKKIFRIINHHLCQNSLSNKIDLHLVRNLIFDGSFLEGRKLSVVILINAQNKKPIAFSFRVRETVKDEVGSFLLRLKGFGLNPQSITIDGLKTVSMAFKEVWPEIIVQRCLFHVQKQGLMWCRRYPKSIEARKLKEIFREIFLIEDYQSKKLFIEKILSWEQKYGNKIAINSSNGWVMSDLKRARSMLLKALSDMFHFLDYPQIPNTSNCAESFFSKLKENLKIHRGLTKEKRLYLIKHIIRLCQK